MLQKKANHLIKENSPYLQQHAYNPVDWHPWSLSLLSFAQQTNKPLLISIGYAACHWCHVMEHESFEDEEVAELMNTHFVNIKIDREEYPDLDQTYMNALQLMQNSGGWPLNIVALPDGRPFWGSTYVRKNDWMDVLRQLSHIYQTDIEKVTEYADRLQKGLQIFNLVEKPKEPVSFSHQQIQEAVNGWQARWDMEYGGNKGAPKFMMPAQLEFLLQYGQHPLTESASDFLSITLKRMAYGGLYDTVGGGFSRYSVDAKWHVPHFEKMLYDNAQLISLYAKAFITFKKTLFKEVITQTIQFIERELMDENGMGYASLDADSPNATGHPEEGAYYVWTKTELENLLGINYPLFADAYNINPFGHWEHNRYVLIRTKETDELAMQHLIPEAMVESTLEYCKSQLLEYRSKRNKPGLDHKILTSWNGLLIEGYVQAYYALQQPDYLSAAETAMNFILTKLTNEHGELLHSYNPHKSIEGYLEDYTTVTQALLSLYEATGNISYLKEAKSFTDICLDEFLDQTTGLFFFTSGKSPVIVQRNIEKADNVIPASNSIMAHNLYKLSIYLENTYYYTVYNEMLTNMLSEALQYPGSYANWLKLALLKCSNTFEVVITGSKCNELLLALKQYYLPNVLCAISREASDLPLFKNRHNPHETLIYVCTNNSCKLPVNNVSDALKQLGYH